MMMIERQKPTTFNKFFDRLNGVEDENGVMEKREEESNALLYVERVMGITQRREHNSTIDPHRVVFGHMVNNGCIPYDSGSEYCYARIPGTVLTVGIDRDGQLYKKLNGTNHAIRYYIEKRYIENSEDSDGWCIPSPPDLHVERMMDGDTGDLFRSAMRNTGMKADVLFKDMFLHMIKQDYSFLKYPADGDRTVLYNEHLLITGIGTTNYIQFFFRDGREDAIIDCLREHDYETAIAIAVNGVNEYFKTDHEVKYHKQLFTKEGSRGFREDDSLDYRPRPTRETPENRLRGDSA